MVMPKPNTDPVNPPTPGPNNPPVVPPVEPVVHAPYDYVATALKALVGFIVGAAVFAAPKLISSGDPGAVINYHTLIAGAVGSGLLGLVAVLQGYANNRIAVTKAQMARAARRK